MNSAKYCSAGSSFWLLDWMNHEKYTQPFGRYHMRNEIGGFHFFHITRPFLDFEILRSRVILIPSDQRYT